MITFDRGNNRFNLRVAGLAIHNKKVLLHQYEGFEFWALPGGRVEFNESTIETILREIKEELGEDIIVERLLWCCESFFDHIGKEFHEICFYYLIRFSENSQLLRIEDEFEVREIDGSILTFKWFDFKDVKELELYPEFIKGKVSSLSNEIEHIIDCPN